MLKDDQCILCDVSLNWGRSELVLCPNTIPAPQMNSVDTTVADDAAKIIDDKQDKRTGTESEYFDLRVEEPEYVLDYQRALGKKKPHMFMNGNQLELIVRHRDRWVFV
jgi:hypothetical protein